MAYSARPLSTDELTKLVFQPAHGFSVGEVVSYRPVLGVPEYVRSLADTLVHCQTPVMVTIVVDADNFYVTQVGYVTGLVSGTPYTDGTIYYLSPTVPGGLTTVQPTTVGQVVSPVFVADSTTSGYFCTFFGIEVEDIPVVHDWITVNSDQSIVANKGYLIDSAVNINMTLPVSMSVGQTFQIASINTGGFTILQNGGQTINYIQSDTAVGVGGSLALAATLGVLSGSIEVLCTATDTNFKVIKSTGNYTIV